MLASRMWIVRPSKLKANNFRASLKYISTLIVILQIIIVQKIIIFSLFRNYNLIKIEYVNKSNIRSLNQIQFILR